MLRNKPPMTKSEAEEVVARMFAETPKNAMRFMLKTALGPIGHLDAEAKEVYRAALAKLGG